MISRARAGASLSIFRLAALTAGLPLLALAVLAATATAGEVLPPTTPVLVYHSTDPEGAAPEASLPPGCESAGESNLITWTLQGVDFSDERTATGSFDYDVSTGTLTAWSIAVTAGTGFPAVTYTEGNSTASFFSFGDPFPRLTFQINSSVRQFRITPSASLASPATAPLNTSASGGSGSVECFNCAPFRNIVSGSLVGEAVPSGGLACALTGSENDVIELWVDGGSGNGSGNLCQLGPLGNNGDHVCGADLLLEITAGSGRFTEIDVLDGTLVHSPDCVPSDGEDCFLPSEPGTTELRMNFRRGEGDPPLGPRLIANVHLDTSSSSVENPTIVKLRNFIAAGAALQERPLATLASGEGDAEILAKGPIPVPEPGRLVMLVSGLTGLWALHRRRQRRRAP